jgi:anti-sigma factor ChrR (cupin superfamily)
MEDKIFSNIEKERIKKENRKLDKIHKETCDAINAKMDEVLQCLVKKNSILNFKSLEEIPLRKMYKLKKGVRLFKIENTKNSLVFETYMEPSTCLSLHSHDCYEIVQIIYGHLKDNVKPKHTYEAGDRLIYDRLEKHEPKTDLQSKYLITFIK